MFTSKINIDGVAISLSFLCIVHCLFTPSFIILAPSFLAFSLDNEFIHYLIILLAIPISLYALTSGYRAHDRISFLFIGIFGLSILFLAILMGENIFGEYGEKGLTLLGSIIVAFSHFKNLKICKELDCDCHS
jgi:4-amino-4-deoxy-L-arabinose transferase-like glycosyltransferase